MDAVEVNTSEIPQNDGSIVSAVEICRVCLLGNLMMQDLFQEGEDASLSDKAMTFSTVKMSPEDGLPSKICCDCAVKLESAYNFKLQIEQADNILRERLDSLNIKAELFFGEELDRNGAVQIRTQFERNTVSLSEHTRDESSLLKHALMQVDTIHEQHHLEQQTLNKVGRTYITGSELLRMQSQQLQELENNHELQDIHETNITDIEEHVVQVSNKTELRQEKNKCNQGMDKIQCLQRENEMHQMQEMQISHMQMETIQEKQLSQIQEEAIRDIIQNDGQFCEKVEENINQNLEQLSENGEYILSQQPEACMEEETLPTSVQNSYIADLADIKFEECKDDIVNENSFQNIDPKTEQESSNETRRSKRKINKESNDRDSDEENYFENLNLSSRLKKVQKEKSETIFYMCYLCDKQFLSKEVLKEHMHSHEEVRKTLSLSKKPPLKPDKIDKLQKTLPLTQPKTPSSGKQANKCPHCGKEYLYVNSYSKHLKQHEKEKRGRKLKSETSDASVDEDETLDFEDYDNYQSSDGDEEMPEESETIENKTAENKKLKTNINKSLDKNQEIKTECVKYESLKCTICDKEFATMETLRDHRSIHVMHGVLTDLDISDAQEQANGDNKELIEIDQNIKIPKEISVEKSEVKCDGIQTLPESNKKSLSKQIETHHTNYVCKVCQQQFTKKEQLRKHAEQHNKVKSFICTQCSKTFGNELTLRNHLIATNHKTTIHGQEYDPNKRLKRVAAKAAQKIIDKIRTEDGLDECDDDDSEYDKDSQEEVVDNELFPAASKKPAQSKPLHCATCNKKCVSKQVLAKHMEQHIKYEKEEKANLEKAKTVEKREVEDDRHDNDDDDDFGGGLDWPVDNHECVTCKKRYSTKKSLLRHQLLHEDPNFECDICNVKFYRKDKLKAHYDKCSEKNPDQVRKCNICGDSFENNDILREHRARHVTEGILTEEDLKEIEPRSADEKKLTEKIPRKRRTDIVGLECTECNKQYTSRKGLLRHIQVHEGKKYLCDICPKKFYRREHLKIHVAKHNMIKPYKCNRCTKRFIKEEQLTTHLTKHDRAFKKTKDADTSKRFLCEICSKSFTQSTTLIAHLRAHNGIKPYVCEVCSRPFTTNAYLKMHMRTHTQERPYICQYCSRAFARADTLANHLTSHTGEAKYHCKYCPKNFRRLKSLKEHVFIHTGQRPYACPTCNRRFNNNGSRYAHSKRCKQNLVQNQARTQTTQQILIHQPQQLQQDQQQQEQQLQQVQLHQRLQQTIGQAQIIKSQNIKTITITRPADAMTQQVLQHQEILMPLILPLTVTLTDVGDEVILPDSAKIFTTT